MFGVLARLLRRRDPFDRLQALVGSAPCPQDLEGLYGYRLMPVSATRACDSHHRTTAGLSLASRKALMHLIAVPVILCSLGVVHYVHSSPFDTDDALGHLVARAGCPAACLAGVAPAQRGQPGYHLSNDRDRDGVACERPSARAVGKRSAPQAGRLAERREAARHVGSAKFVRP